MRSMNPFSKQPETEHFDELGRGAHGLHRNAPCASYRARSVVARRVIRLLLALDGARLGLTVRELMDVSGLGEKSVYRYVRALEREGVPIVWHEKERRDESQRISILKWR